MIIADLCPHWKDSKDSIVNCKIDHVEFDMNDRFWAEHGIYITTTIVHYHQHDRIMKLHTFIPDNTIWVAQEQLL